MIEKLVIKERQKEVLACEHKFINVFAGRGFGKTGVGICKAVNRLIIPKSQVYYVAPTNTQANRIIWNAIKRVVPREWIKVKGIRESSPKELELVNGSTFTVFSAKAHDRVRGEGCDLCICDEIQDFPIEAWQESIYPAIARKDGSAFLIGTPKGKSNWTYELTKDENYKFFTFTSLDGGWIKPNVIERARQMLPEKTFRQEFEASFETAGLVVYDSYGEHNYSTEVFDRQRDTIITFDFNVNPMSAIIIQRLENDNYVAVKEFVLHNSNTDETCRAIINFLDNKSFEGSLQITGDYSGNSRKTSSVAKSDYKIIESYFKNFNNYRLRTSPTRSVKDRVIATNAMFRTYSGDVKLFINRYECPNTHEDLVKTEWNESKFELNSRNKERTHQSDALSYFPYNFFPIHRSIYKIIK